jgi:mannose-6-phosphate isomerase
MSLYPLKFTPILKERIWGGNLLETKLFKEHASPGIGESWELSSVEGSVSVVANGILKDTSLADLMSTHKSDLLGSSVVRDFGYNFPVLIKFLDAASNLSIQVHPSDELAKERHNSFGKNEMWYVMEASSEASLIVGFKEGMTPEKYKSHIENGTIESVMEKHAVTSGDTFFIETGTVHAIGAGILLAEIQQTSDITYRVYDFNRTDAHGNFRELHTELALDAINFKLNPPEKCNYEVKTNEKNELISSPYFTTKYLPVIGKYQEECLSSDSFKAYLCVKGNGVISNNFGTAEFSYGETILLAANSTFISVESVSGCVLIEVQY